MEDENIHAKMGLNKNCKGTKNLALQYWLQKELIVEQVQVAQAADLFRHGCSSSKKRPKSRKDPELCPVPVPETDRPRLSRSPSKKRFSLKQADNRTNSFLRSSLQSLLFLRLQTLQWKLSPCRLKKVN